MNDEIAQCSAEDKYVLKKREEAATGEAGQSSSRSQTCSTRTNNRRLKSTRNKLTERYVVTNGYNI
jgi:hypothetical protein